MPPLLLTALSWAWSNHRLLAILAAVAAVFFTGEHMGGARVRRDWEAAEKLRDEAQKKEQADRQAAANKAETVNARTIARLNEKVTNLSRSLNNATHDPAYRCTPTPDGLQQLNDILAAAGRAASQRDD